MRTIKKAAPNGNGNNSTTKVRKSPYKKSLAVKKLEQMATDEHGKNTL
jgi:hypothetical protein